jgi:hypothetical protein
MSCKPLTNNLTLACGSSSVKKSVELLFDVVSEVGEVFVKILWAGGWKLELHSGELIDNVFLEGFLNQSKGDLLVTVLGFSNNSLGVIVEVHDGSHHTDGLWKWAVLVIWGERVLLQEFFFDDLSNLNKHVIRMS